MGFGRPTTAALAGSSTHFGTTPVGVSAQATATVTATTSVTVTGVTTSSPFGIGALPTLPVT